MRRRLIAAIVLVAAIATLVLGVSAIRHGTDPDGALKYVFGPVVLLVAPFSILISGFVLAAGGDARRRERVLADAGQLHTHTVPGLEPKTVTERYFFGQLRPLLGPNERVEACAYVSPRLSGDNHGFAAIVEARSRRSAFLALTDQRLVAIETRIPAFSPLLENEGVWSIDRTAIRGAHVPRRRGILALDVEGRLKPLTFKASRSTRYVRSQASFFDRIGQTWQPTSDLDPVIAIERRERIANVVFAIFLVAIVVFGIVAAAGKRH